MSRAAIDVGSNSLLLTVVSDDGAVLHDEARVVGLGRGLGDRGVLAPDRMRAAEAVLVDYLEIALTHGVPPWAVRAVATSAARRAMNAETWVARIQQKLGLRIDIVSGDEEARLTWLGALRDLDVGDGPYLVVDLGGGSTELVLGTPAEVDHRRSLPLGSVRMTEEFLGIERVDPEGVAHARDFAEVVVQRFPMHPAPVTVIGVAGSVTTLSATAQGLEAYDSERVHASRLGRDDLAAAIDRLLPLDAEGRRAAVPVAPDRSDYLVAAAVILDVVLEAAGADAMVVSDRGLRFGLLSY